MGYPFEDRAKIAAQCGRDLSAFRARDERYALEKTADGVSCFVPVLRLLQCFRKSFDLAAVNASNVRMNPVYRAAGAKGVRSAPLAWLRGREDAPSAGGCSRRFQWGDDLR